ncbi:MAG: hypothetical protein COX70_09385 [Flavobacteriales bacterium CG_4_10_14_0_2_um_filter_32_8]|nr:MAG: hypothetical protein COX70_09385 [Flavobacteriales bacterium CG_4_10_14_0_2_um_filter_32_8]PJB15464.1 MAG: hypothetical protein CO118_03405 [Flavobacteriales bacterium CG_4_9_14_3_um_filter_32_8]
MKKMFILPVALMAMMVVSCGPTQEEIAAKEQAIADSTAAYDAQIQAEADAVAAAAEAEAAAAAAADTTAATEEVAK